MSRASFTIAYDGPSLRGGTMDVRDLAPALLGVGQLFDAANAALNRDTARINVNVTATGSGSFEIFFEVVQSIASQVTALFSGETVTAAINLKDLVIGGSFGLIWLIKRLRGGKPDKIERISDSQVRITIGTETFDVPMALMRLYQDLAVRTAAERVVAEPLRREGIDKFEARENGQRLITVNKSEAEFFTRPILPEETLLESTRRAAFSIISLAFKEDNKWRLYDGNTTISALIEDEDFLRRVDGNQVAFAKGDILICDVKVTQKRTAAGLTTEYIVEKVIDHRPGARQLPLAFDEAPSMPIVEFRNEGPEPQPPQDTGSKKQP